MVDGQNGEHMVNATGRVDGERNTGIGNVQTLSPEMEDAFAADVIINIHRASWKIAQVRLFRSIKVNVLSS